MNQGNFKWDDPPSKENPLMWRKSQHYLGGFLSEIPTSYHRLLSANHLPSRKSDGIFTLNSQVELEHFSLSLSDLPAQAATPMPMLPSWTEMHRPHEEGSAPVPVRGIFVSLFSRSSNCLIFQSFISHLSNFVNAKQSQVAEFVHISVSSQSSLWNSKKNKSIQLIQPKICELVYKPKVLDFSLKNI